jgi:hypothetical protein
MKKQFIHISASKGEEGKHNINFSDLLPKIQRKPKVVSVLKKRLTGN